MKTQILLCAVMLFSIAGFAQEIQTDSLKAVEINNKYKYRREKSTTVSKMPLKDLENSQVVSSITSGLLKEQVNISFDDALNNATGVTKLWESTGRGGDGGGYFGSRGFSVQPGLKNGLPNVGNGTPDPANIETIEVIKGPSGTLYGGALTSHGGLININTKQPFGETKTDISYTFGSFNTHRATIDHNQTLSLDKKTAFRINAAYTNKENFQDYGFSKSFFIAPSLLWTINDKLSFVVNAEFMDSEGTNPTMLFMDRDSPVRANTVEKTGYDNKRSYTSNDLTLENPYYNLQATANYTINNHWTSKTSFSNYTSYSKGYYTYLYEGTSLIEKTLAPLIGPFTVDGAIYARSVSKMDSKNKGLDIQQNFLGDFKIGDLNNKLLVGADYYHENIETDNSSYGNQGFVHVGGSSNAQFQALVPYLHTAYGSPIKMNEQGDDSGDLTPKGADQVITFSTPDNASLDNYSFYVSDVLNVTDNLFLNAAVRYDVYESKYSSASNSFSKDFSNWSPKFGIIFQPIKEQISIFANYQNGFGRPQQIADYVAGVANNYYAKPEQSIQYEGGVKLDFFKGKLSGTLSYFDITVNDKTIFIGDYTNGHNDQNGKQRNKGFEAQFLLAPLKGWNVTAGYSYIDSKLLEGDAVFVGLRPESAGPYNNANLWTSYKFTENFIKGFGLGLGANYGGEYATLNRNFTGQFYLPEYLVFGATAFYETSNFRIAVKADNLTNEEYYRGWSTINPQTPRSFLGSVSYKF
ncbi:TonB-dependent siderophore receptor [Flavobacterium aquicola]|uniref:Iron complex outermembrane receptor protein n=1 Tax=Flavobacterium aquicola TaxID=1682742 RepID=A0A3E0EJQ8_9FLAO|nr:TonB-dependent receptor [Flavobacterium aquicola]REG98411.1 iron complex outermembrane receptor protein [Flavobacterium aquicola]